MPPGAKNEPCPSRSLSRPETVLRKLSPQSRLIVTGQIGCGKTTLARKISARLGLAHLHIDDYCLCDVLDTYFVHLRTALLRGMVRPDDEKALVESAHALIEAHAQEYPGLAEYLGKFRYWSAPEPDGDGFLP